MFVIVSFILLIVFAWLVKNERLMTVLLTWLLIGLSFLTPFWPIVVGGMYLKFKIQEHHKLKKGGNKRYVNNQ